MRGAILDSIRDEDEPMGIRDLADSVARRLRKHKFALYDRRDLERPMKGDQFKDRLLALIVAEMTLAATGRISAHSLDDETKQSNQRSWWDH